VGLPIAVRKNERHPPLSSRHFVDARHKKPARHRRDGGRRYRSWHLTGESVIARFPDRNSNAFARYAISTWLAECRRRITPLALANGETHHFAPECPARAPAHPRRNPPRILVHPCWRIVGARAGAVRFEAPRPASFRVLKGVRRAERSSRATFPIFSRLGALGVPWAPLPFPAPRLATLLLKLCAATFPPAPPAFCRDKEGVMRRLALAISLIKS